MSNLMKRKLSAIAILGLVLSGLSAYPAKATSLDVNGNGTVSCTTGSFTVTNFVAVSHSSCTGHAEIPAGVTSIAGMAFDNSRSLTSVTIPNSVTSIGNAAFSGTGLVTVTIPNSVTSIGILAFFDARELTSIAIPNSVTSIGGSAFAGAVSLTSVTLPSSITSIAAQTFDGARSLTSITIPNSVVTIGGSAFWGTALTSLVIPNSVVSIGNFAFAAAASLSSVTIPGSITSIGASAFSGATSLNTVTLLGSPPATVGDSAFRHVPSGARALVGRTQVGTDAGKYGNVGDSWNGLRVSLPSATLSLNSEGVVTTQSVEETVAPANPQLSRSGFRLSGWSSTEGGSASFASDLSDFTMGSSATTLFAVWEQLPATQEETPAFQFSGPLLTGFDKRSITQDLQTSITFRGKRMNQVLSATIDGVPIVIESSSRTHLTIAIEAMKPGTYTIVLQSRSGSLSLFRFLIVK